MSKVKILLIVFILVHISRAAPHHYYRDMGDTGFKDDVVLRIDPRGGRTPTTALDMPIVKTDDVTAKHASTAKSALATAKEEKVNELKLKLIFIFLYFKLLLMFVILGFLLGFFIEWAHDWCNTPKNEQRIPPTIQDYFKK